MLNTTSSTENRHVFLSYSSHDQDLALELKRELEQNGVNVWIDIDRLRLGSFIITELEQALENASSFVVLVTESALASGWVREEYGRAVQLSVQSAFRFPIIPIAVGGAVIPGFLGNYRALQLSDRSSLTSIAAHIAVELSTESGTQNNQKRRTMIRWHSRSSSFANGDISILAIIETFGAVAALIALSTYRGSLSYVAWLACIAPFALLQTDQSRSMGIRLLSHLQWWTRLKPDAEGHSRIAKTIQIATLVLIPLLLAAIENPDSEQLFRLNPKEEGVVRLYFIGLCCAGFCALLLAMSPPLLVRFAATVFTAIRHPVTTLRAVPVNWKNLILCKDLLEEPEVVPGYLDAVATRELSSDLRFPNFLNGMESGFLLGQIPRVHCCQGFPQGLEVIFRFSITTMTLVASFLLYAPYYFSRWALKSTALLWAPLLWVASAAIGSSLPPRLRLQFITDDATNRIVYAFSWLILILFVTSLLGIFPASSGFINGYGRIIPFSQQPHIALPTVGAALIAIGLRLIASRTLLLHSHKTMLLTRINHAINLAIFIQRLIVVFLLVMLLGEILRQY